MKKHFFTLLTILFAHYLTLAQLNDARLLRFPALHGNKVAFTYAGDLYTVARTGGIARKLTADAGMEMYSRYSPDGNTLAFCAQYDGNTELYKMPADGGVPVRLTYTATLNRDEVSDRMGPSNILMTWRDNETLVYRSRMKSFNDFMGQLYLANINGGLSVQMPLPAGGNCSFSPDKKRMAYNRIMREYRTWKYYKGGMADDIWIYDFDSKKIENITNNVSQDIFPMWTDNKIYFCSDRERTMNIFCYDLITKQTRKVTSYTQYDVKFPSLGDDAIIYENGGWLYTLDLKTEQIQKINITIADDLVTGRNEWVDGTKNVQSTSLSPDGMRMLMNARGDVFSIPAKTGITYNYSKSSNSHERSASWSPDGKWISYISDMTGEDEIYIQKADATEAAKQLTKNADTYKYGFIWSPDSKKILWNDQQKRLNCVDVASGNMMVIAKSVTGEINDFTWSSDSKWVSYSDSKVGQKNILYLYEMATAKITPITTQWYDSYSPSFSSDGKYLFFISDRDFNPTYSNTEWNHSYSDMSKIYFVTLAANTTSPFAPVNDAVAITNSEENKPATDDKTKDAKKKDEPKAAASKDVKVDLDGIQNRIGVLPISASGYFGLSIIDNSVYYMKRGNGDEATALKLFDLKDKKETDLGEIDGYEIGNNNKKMLVRKAKGYYIIDLPKGKLDLKESINTSDVKVLVDRKAEWKQIFDESWRQMRYFFYDSNMHGVDWPAMKAKYEVLLPYVNHRADLSYIIGEMIGELSIGHAYVGGGDLPKAERIQLGLLGADLVREANGYYRIAKILKGENWTGNLRCPLTDIGVNAIEGDYIVAVNGMPTNTLNDINVAFVNTVGKQVELQINSQASATGARKALVTPISTQAPLEYYTWVQKNIDRVSAATDGKVGYLHIPNMGVEGLNEFAKYFYPQLNKEALIIDDRGNGGGNVSPMIIERLNRELAMINVARNTAPYTNPFQMVNGPKVVLINEYSASDGDLFPYRFKKYNMGKVIGKRSWGGVVGIRGTMFFVDGGYLNRPEFGPYDIEGKQWIIEGYGVDPDIVVDNDPATEFAGTDQQLERAIQQILEDLKTQGKKLPPPPPYPMKNK